MTTSINFIDKYLNINIPSNFIHLFQNEQNFNIVVDNIQNYQQMYKKYLINSQDVKTILINHIKKYIDLTYNKINVNSADINYYIEHIYLNNKIKFKDIIKKMDINHIINMIDYCNDNNDNNDNNSTPASTYKFLMDEYYKLFCNNIIYNIYGREKKTIYDHIQENWNNINFQHLLNYMDILSKLKYYGNDVNKYVDLIQNKFDDVNNINKLINYINITFINKKCNYINEDNDDKDTKFNFRYILENLKSNGYLFFEQYFKEIQSRYLQQNNINIINNELKLIKYFIIIISMKDKTNVNRYVNEMLIKIRDYIFDIQDSYYNNIAYQKISIRVESDKYKNIKLEKYQRELTNFKILKYNFNTSNQLIDCDNIPISLVPYLDIYKSYYKTRYPDRAVEYDFINSALIVKICFNSGTYYIHMALLQYIILDNIMSTSLNGISANKLSKKINIPLSKLNDTFNSLLKIKIIKYITIDKDIIFVLNSDFTFDKNKLSISGLIQPKINETTIKSREFLHDRNMIVLCNLIYWAKKNKYFTQDVLLEQLQYVVPFKLNDEYIQIALEKAISSEYIKEIKIPSNNGDGTFQIMYKYSVE